MIEPDNDKVSIRRQCELLDLSRATYYYEPCKESEFNLKLMSLIDKQYTKTPFYGCLRMTASLNHEGYAINSKRVRRLMRLMGLLAIYPKSRTTIAGAGHKIYPYLLRNLAITRPNQVWSADITYIPMLHGFMYLVAIIDVYSRYVVAWQLSNTLDGLFCLDVLEKALSYGRPEIFNTDQGAQFTATAFTSRLEAAGICISMDGKGRALDNVFVERLWRSVKQEHIYLYAYETVIQLEKGLRDYFWFYNQERPHQSLDYQAPVEVYRLVSACSVAA
jgi:putative transposase